MRGVSSEYRYSGRAAVAPSHEAREKRPDCSRALPSGRLVTRDVCAASEEMRGFLDSLRSLGMARLFS